MRLAVLRERRAGETRVAATPDTVRKLVALGLEVAVEAGAGLGSAVPDEEFRAAGATVVPDAAAALSGAGVVFAVRAPEPDGRALLPRGALLACIAGAHDDPGLASDMAARGVDLAAMELLPRITRAQSMDVLSSQANLSGYRAVIEGAGAFERGFPMMMTAAGTVPPARVFVIGAGVAGLQAIATARRLGAIVSATDVRPAAKEEIRSLGATFVGVEDAESAAQTGAYAREMSEDFRRKQGELMAATVAKNDMVICTALVMGRRAPVIVTNAMVAAMRPGSVVVDLAAEAGGNCEATVPGEVHTTANGVKVLGHRNWPGRIAVAASALYSRNLLTFLTTFWDKDAKAPSLPETDDIVRGVLITRGGAVVQEQFRGAPAGSGAAVAPAASGGAAAGPTVGAASGPAGGSGPAPAAAPSVLPSDPGVRADVPSEPAPPHQQSATVVPVASGPDASRPGVPRDVSGGAAPAGEAETLLAPPAGAVADSPTFAPRGPGAAAADQALSFVPPGAAAEGAGPAASGVAAAAVPGAGAAAVASAVPAPAVAAAPHTAPEQALASPPAAVVAVPEPAAVPPLPAAPPPPA